MTDGTTEPAAALSGQISLKVNKREWEEMWYPAKSGFWNFKIDDILKVEVKHPECVFHICKQESKVNFQQ